MTETNLVVPIKITPELLFAPKGLDPILAAVEKKVKEFKGSIETDKGRKEIASFAYKIAQTKTTIEKWGKDLVSGEKTKLKLIDAERKRSKDFLTEQAAIARKPLTDFETAEKERIEKERQLEIFNLDHEEALGMEDLFERERVLAEKEAKIAKEEHAKREKEEKERLENERIEREAQIKKEAAEKAKQEAENRISAEKEKNERLEREAVEAEERAKKEKADAVQKAKDDAEAKIRIEKEIEAKRIADDKAIADRKAANLNHQRRINKEALTDLMTIVGEEQGKEIIKALVNNQIRHITINY